MRLLLLLIVALAGLLPMTGCRKEAARDLNCERLRTALLNNEVAVVRDEINRVTLAYRRSEVESDTYGQRQNTEDLVRRLNEACGLTATLLCYNCVFTLPPQSEILVIVPNGTTPVRKVIDLSYDSYGHLVFAGLHD